MAPPCHIFFNAYDLRLKFKLDFQFTSERRHHNAKAERHVI